jgi:uncharacterized protein (DUF1501 family)
MKPTTRRDLLLAAGAAGLAGGLTAALPGAAAARALPGWRGDRVLVLLELAGGNDGLNTVVPYADPAYHALRPAIGLKREQIAPLDERTGLHKSLEALMPAWTAGEVAVVQGVGYERPNRSHFRSIDIWESASGAERVVGEGWIARLFAGRPRPPGLLADAVVLGGGLGAVSGPKISAAVMPNPERFLRQAEAMERRPDAATNPALGHLVRVEREVADVAKGLRTLIANAPAPKAEFPPGVLGEELKVAARLIAAGARVPVVKLALGGFDTHAGQPGPHANLLKQVGDGLAAFRQAMIAAGQWNRVLVMTYSEFGRRARQNGSNGTDHGTAAPHFFIGSAVKGGLYGAAPNLADLDGGDLRHALDYRALYATVAERWWVLGPTASVLGPQRPLPVLKG